MQTLQILVAARVEFYTKGEALGFVAPAPVQELMAQYRADGACESLIAAVRLGSGN